MANADPTQAVTAYVDKIKEINTLLVSTLDAFKEHAEDISTAEDNFEKVEELNNQLEQFMQDLDEKAKAAGAEAEQLAATADSAANEGLSAAAQTAEAHASQIKEAASSAGAEVEQANQAVQQEGLAAVEETTNGVSETVDAQDAKMTEVEDQHTSELENDESEHADAQDSMTEAHGAAHEDATAMDDHATGAFDEESSDDDQLRADIETAAAEYGETDDFEEHDGQVAEEADHLAETGKGHIDDLNNHVTGDLHSQADAALQEGIAAFESLMAALDTHQQDLEDANQKVTTLHADMPEVARAKETLPNIQDVLTQLSNVSQ